MSQAFMKGYNTLLLRRLRKICKGQASLIR
jgi:hypothetical protein